MNNYTIEIDDMLDYFDWYDWKDVSAGSELVRSLSRMMDPGWTNYDYKTLFF